MGSIASSTGPDGEHRQSPSRAQAQGNPSAGLAAGGAHECGGHDPCHARPHDARARGDHDTPGADPGPAPGTPTGTLTCGPIVTTLMARTPEHMARERAVLDLLAHPVRATVADGALVLVDGEGRVSRLLPAPAEESV